MDGCWKCHLQGIGILRMAGAEAVAYFDRCRATRQYVRGEVLFREGEPSPGMYCVSTGRIKLYRTLPSGDVQITRLAGGGSVLGHTALLTETPLGATAEVLTPSTICFLPASTVKESLERDPAVAMNMMRSLALELAEAEAHLCNVALLPATARLASVLLELTDEDGAVPPLTREELGQMCGTRLESISRALRELEVSGAIRRNGRAIVVADRASLIEIKDAGGPPR